MMHKHVLLLQKHAASPLLEQIAAEPTHVYAAALLSIDSAEEAVTVLESLVWERVILAAEGEDCEAALCVAAAMPSRIAGLLLLDPACLPDESLCIPTLIITTGGFRAELTGKADRYCLSDSSSAHLSEIINAFLTLRVE
jgi:pimeloyl-ACP methyl ester carboxylesterase